jgi:hypothetical protein
MSIHLIGIGGTGAKCVEAVTHLAAAGLMPATTIACHFVDADRTNGNLARAKSALDLYGAARQLLSAPTPLMQTVLVAEEPWSPLTYDAPASIPDAPVRRPGDSPTFQDHFNRTHLSSAAPHLAKLMDVLFTDDEQAANLDVGFRGRPAMGSAALADSLRTLPPFWTRFFKAIEEVKPGAEVKVVLVGSVFGGTGASGIPTIARIIKDWKNEKRRPNVKVAGVLLLPYFHFDEVQEDVAAKSAEFEQNAKAALAYFQETSDLFQSVYFAGESVSAVIPHSSLGRGSQLNPPLVTELIAALAVTDFAGTPTDGFHLATRNDSGSVTWSDLPSAGESSLQIRVTQMAKFALAMHLLFAPLLKDILKHKAEERAPWFVDFFSRHGHSVGDAETLKPLLEYCLEYLRWHNSMRDTHTASALDIRLLNVREALKTVAETAKGSYVDGDLETALQIDVVGALAGNSIGLHHIWETVCADTGRKPGIGPLLAAIFDASAPASGKRN